MFEDYYTWQQFYMERPQVAPSMQYITIQLVTERGFLSWLIRWLTWSDYSHVDFVVSTGLVGARFRGGVTHRDFKYGKFRNVKRYRVQVPEVKAQVLYLWLSDQFDKPYDWRGIVNFFFRRNHFWRQEDSWFCSELVAAAFEQIGMPLLALKECDRVTPRDLTLSCVLEEVA